MSKILGTVGALTILLKELLEFSEEKNRCLFFVEENIKCVVLNSKRTPFSQLIGQLPYERINESRVFNYTGLDLCGSFHVKFSARVP